MTRSAPEVSPEVSIVIAARNEGALLGKALAALKEQSFERPYEVIVVDNASSDDTGSIGVEYGAIVLFEPEMGQLQAKRRGVSHARGNIIVVLDADCVPNRDWLNEIARFFQDGANATVSAATCYYDFDPDLPVWGALYCQAVKLFLLSPYRLLNLSLPFVLGGNVAFRRTSMIDGYPLEGGIAATEYRLAKQLRQHGDVRYLKSMRVRSSARTFLRGPYYFFVSYKLRAYFLPLLSRRNRPVTQELEGQP